nr:hypothetical protein [Microbacterium ulmi]
MQFSYDAAGRHAGTTYTGGTTVAVKRDAAGRIVSGTSDPAGSAPASTVTYFFDGAGDVAWGQRTGTTVSRTAALPGGVTVTATSTTSATWSYPSLQGHALATGPGSSTGSLLLTDPYGQPLDAATLAIGTAAADDTGQVTGNTGWHQAALKVADTAGSTLLIEMGARLYVPNLGRFLQVDPIEGGVDNDYTWPTDPIGKNDLTGRAWWNDVLSGSATLVRDLGAWAYENRSFLAHTALSIGAGILTVALTTAVCAGTAGLGCAVAAGAAISMMVQVVPHFALDKAMGVRTSPADAVSYVAGSALRGGIGVPRSIVTKTVVQATKQTAKTVTRVVGGFLRSLVVF